MQVSTTVWVFVELGATDPNPPGYCRGSMEPCGPGGLHMLCLGWEDLTPACLFKGL